MESKPIESARISRQPSSQKKSYQAPTLLRWGTLRDMTLAVGSTGGKDGGKGKRPRRTR
jgi:hypothetical protein